MKKILEQSGFTIESMGTYTHVVSAGYLVHKLSSYNRPLSSIARKFLETLRLQNSHVPVNFGDFITVIARPI